MVLLEAGDFLSGSNNPFKNISMINLALLFHNTVFSSWHKEKKELVLSLKSCLQIKTLMFGALTSQIY
jgi:hypothetical protein